MNLIVSWMQLSCLRTAVQTPMRRAVDPMDADLISSCSLCRIAHTEMSGIAHFAGEGPRS